MNRESQLKAGRKSFAKMVRRAKRADAQTTNPYWSQRRGSHERSMFEPTTVNEALYNHYVRNIQRTYRITI